MNTFFVSLLTQYIGPNNFLNFVEFVRCNFSTTFYLNEWCVRTKLTLLRVRRRFKLGLHFKFRHTSTVLVVTLNVFFVFFNVCLQLATMF